MRDETNPSAAAPEGQVGLGNVRAALLLAACADALGGARDAGAEAVAGRTLRWGETTWRMLALAGHLVENRGTVDAPMLARTLNGTQDAGRDGGPAADSPGGLAARRSSRSGGSDVTWLAPVGLIGRDQPATAAAARGAAGLLSLDPVVQDCGAVVAVGYATLAHDLAGRPLEIDALVARMAVHAGTPQVRRMLATARALARQEASATTFGEYLADFPAALSTTAAALAMFLIHPLDPAAVLRHAVPHPAVDGAAAAVLAAGLCGAHGGESVVPSGWGAGLESSFLLWSAAADLCRISAHRAGSATRPVQHAD